MRCRSDAGIARGLQASRQTCRSSDGRVAASEASNRLPYPRPSRRGDSSAVRAVRREPAAGCPRPNWVGRPRQPRRARHPGEARHRPSRPRRPDTDRLTQRDDIVLLYRMVDGGHHVPNPRDDARGDQPRRICIRTDLPRCQDACRSIGAIPKATHRQDDLAVDAVLAREPHVGHGHRADTTELRPARYSKSAT